jgi:hypothetical protein
MTLGLRVLQDLLQSADVSATAALTRGIASGPGSRNGADVGSRSRLVVSLMPLAVGWRR